MATRNVEIFDEQTGITGVSDLFVVEASAQVSAMATITGTGSASLQVTIDPQEVIAAGNATWVNSGSGAQGYTFADASLGPVTGVRLNVSSGTWGLKVLQVIDNNKAG